MGTIKNHIFIMKDFDGKDICELSFQLESPCTVAEANNKMLDFLVEHMDESLETLKMKSKDIIHDWATKKEFPDGTFFFLKSNTSSGFRASYMYKKDIV